MKDCVRFSFPARREYGIFLRMAVSGAAAACDVTVDALEDVRAAAEEALDALLHAAAGETEEILCVLERDAAGSLTLDMRLASREGAPVQEPNVTGAILQTLMHEVTLLRDARGETGVRMTLRAAQ